MRFAVLLSFLHILGFAPAALAQSPDAAFQVIGVDVGDVLNVRARPTVRSAVVGKLAPVAKDIRLIGPTKRNGRTVWQKIKHGSVTGWVNQRFLGRQSSVSRTTSGATAAPKLRTSENVAAKLKKRVALVIGNGRYRHGISLRYGELDTIVVAVRRSARCSHRCHPGRTSCSVPYVRPS